MHLKRKAQKCVISDARARVHQKQRLSTAGSRSRSRGPDEQLLGTLWWPRS